ncbi:hypothetical protein [Robbsia sp. KACC 23696]|uniref:hypothetical protein n=1 Tax=Robbsia sp. KACC 23696 TaxID=3149231 RepID=UPI00325A797C
MSALSFSLDTIADLAAHAEWPRRNATSPFLALLEIDEEQCRLRLTNIGLKPLTRFATNASRLLLFFEQFIDAPTLSSIRSTCTDQWLVEAVPSANALVVRPVRTLAVASKETLEISLTIGLRRSRPDSDIVSSLRHTPLTLGFIGVEGLPRYYAQMIPCEISTTTRVLPLPPLRAYLNSRVVVADQMPRRLMLMISSGQGQPWRISNGLDRDDTVAALAVDTMFCIGFSQADAASLSTWRDALRRATLRVAEPASDAWIVETSRGSVALPRWQLVPKLASERGPTMMTGALLMEIDGLSLDSETAIDLEVTSVATRSHAAYSRTFRLTSCLLVSETETTIAVPDAAATKARQNRLLALQSRHLLDGSVIHTPTLRSKDMIGRPRYALQLRIFNGSSTPLVYLTAFTGPRLNGVSLSVPERAHDVPTERTVLAVFSQLAFDHAITVSYQLERRRVLSITACMYQNGTMRIKAIISPWRDEDRHAEGTVSTVYDAVTDDDIAVFSTIAADAGELRANIVITDRSVATAPLHTRTPLEQ